MEKFESVFAVSSANITQDYHDARSWSPTALWTGSALSFILFLSAYLIVNKAVHYPVPKGPRGLPILGSFPFLTHYPELTLSRWAQKFGPLYSIWLGNQHVVVISSAEVAKDLLVANGSIFSSRKEMYIKSQHILAGRGITTTPYNDTW
ncbi:cytochrome P450 [Apiospora marii]|uniref:Cytochrome P450 n=1 Tax=Apiospora marii TaxID=335849 RepID=A0ABR1RDZ8_9PEZI